MSRWQRKQNERLDNYYSKRRDESGNGECFADTYRQALDMSPLPIAARATVAPVVDPLLRSIAECEARIAAIKDGTVRDDLSFWTGLLARKQAELAARS